nr:hypothetical protein [Clostridiales bacterium]
MRMKRWMALLLSAVMLLAAMPGALAVNNNDVKITGNCPSEDAKARNNGHHYYFAEVDEPRCIESGTVWWFCIYCGDEYEETLPALGHDFRNDWSVMYEASCESGGMQIRFCHRCQQEEVRSIPALGHSWRERTIRQVEPTCTENGYRDYTRQCTRCGMYDGASAVGTTTSQRQTLPALGHDWGPWKVEYPGTCAEKGMNVRKCNRCGKEEYVYTDYSDHQWGPWKVEYPGTCLEKGMNVRKCSVCGKEEYVYSDYGDHDWGEWEVVTPAAPGVPGLEQRVCKHTPNHVEQREIEPLPEHPGLTAAWLYDWDYDENPYPDGTDTFQYNDTVVGVRSIKNTGDVPLAVVSRFVSKAMTFDYYRGDLQPGEEMTEDLGFTHIGDTIDPGTETGELLGTATISVSYAGYDPEGFSFDFDANAVAAGRELCTSNTVSRTYKIIKEKKAELTVTLDARDYFDIDTPKTDFYEGEAGWFYGEVENTGEVPLEIYDYDFSYDPGDTTLGRNINGLKKVLQPGEKTAYVGDAYWFISAGMTFDAYHVDLIKAAGKETETLIGTMTYSVKVRGYEPGTDNVLCEAEKDCTMNLLKPPPKPELTLTWQFDGDQYTNQYDRDEFQPHETVHAWHVIENTGNVDLTVGWHMEFGDGYAFTAGPEHFFSLAPGKYYGTGFGGETVGEHLDPGTATAALLGTSTITFWYTGYDPATGEKLCESDHITRVWKVRKAEASNGVIGISKVDADTEEPLFGAHFELYGSEGSIIAEWDSQELPFYLDGLKT